MASVQAVRSTGYALLFADEKFRADKATPTFKLFFNLFEIMLRALFITKTDVKTFSVVLWKCWAPTQSCWYASLQRYLTEREREPQHELVV